MISEFLEKNFDQTIGISPLLEISITLLGIPLTVAAFLIAFTTLKPSIIYPKTTFFPSNHGEALKVIMNCDDVVCAPLGL